MQGLFELLLATECGDLLTEKNLQPTREIATSCDALDRVAGRARPLVGSDLPLDDEIHLDSLRDWTKKDSAGASIGFDVHQARNNDAT